MKCKELAKTLFMTLTSPGVCTNAGCSLLLRETGTQYCLTQIQGS